MATCGALDRASAMNASLSVARLRRVLLLFRSWINAGGFDASFAVSRHELACVLELPDELDPRVTFLFEAFLVEPAPGQQRVDLITLLTTAAMLSQGTLEEKAALVFSLVDLDTEDDIDEHELALVIATCTGGLGRLGIVTSGEKVAEDDAVAIAIEAFEFVGVGDGDKMTFSAFMKWLVFHPRPQLLFDRISCIFSMSDLARQVRTALDNHAQLAKRDPVAYYEWMHQSITDGHIEQINVVAGPIVGKITMSTVYILLELDANALVKCFAIPYRDYGNNREVVQVYEKQFNAYEPVVICVGNLRPGTPYLFRFLGFCRADRIKCAPSVSTLSKAQNVECYAFESSKQDSSEAQHLELRFFNHLGGFDGNPVNLERMRRLHRSVGISKRPVITIHYGLRFSHLEISTLLNRLHHNEDSLAAILDTIKDSCRGLLLRACSQPLFCYSSNVFLDSAKDLLSAAGLHSSPSWNALQELMRLVWSTYAGQLWETALDDSPTTVLFGGRALVVCCNVPEASPSECALDIQAFVKATPSADQIVIITKQPLAPLELDQGLISGRGDMDLTVNAEDAEGWAILNSLAELCESMLANNVSLVAFAKRDGYQSSISVKNTRLAITQLVCGSWNCTLDARHCQLNTQGGLKVTHGRLIIQHGSEENRPQFGHVVLSSAGEQQTNRLTCKMEIVPLSTNLRAELMLGPVIGFVTTSSANILVEVNEDVLVSCVLTQRLMGATSVVEKHIRAHQPAIFAFSDLWPGSLYDVSFPGVSGGMEGAVVQTPFVDSPAFRLTVLLNDSPLDGSILEWTNPGDTISFLRSASANMLNPAIDLQTDLILHLGSFTSLTRKFSSLLSEWREVETSQAEKNKIQESVRECIRRQWKLSENREILSRGAHWFSSVGVLRSLITRYDIPVSILRLVKEVLEEYGRVGHCNARGALPGERVAYRLQTNAVLLELDTTELVLGKNNNSDLCQLPDRLLSLYQWEALEYWFTSGSSSTEECLVSPVNTILILCDLPLINQSSDRHHPDIPQATSWDEYPGEQMKLLDLIFTRLGTDPACSVILISIGNLPARLAVTEIATGRSFLHFITAPIECRAVLSNTVTQSVATPMRIANRYLIELENDLNYQKESSPTGFYYAIDVVPHYQGAQVAVREYSNGLPDARVVVGPVVGKVTPRSARILVELDRTVDNFVCALVDTASSHRVTVGMAVRSFTPTVLKLEGLKPGARYRIVFEGVLPSKDDDAIWGLVKTPTLTPLTCEWIVVNDSVMKRFAPTDGTQTKSIWSHITKTGMRSFTAQASGAVAHINGDKLGCVSDAFNDRFNPWHYIDDNFLSFPLVNPQFLIHLGGQVDMRSAFSDEELVALLARLAPLQASSGGLTDKGSDSELDRIRTYIRHRMQEVYRISWGLQPVKEMLAHTSNFMFLNRSTDIFFSNVDHLREIMAKHAVATSSEPLDEFALQRGADLLFGIGFELWQLYQNQLWTDLVDRDLDFSNRLSVSKLGYSITSGLTKMVFLNVCPDAFNYCTQVDLGVKSDTNSSPTKLTPVNMFSKETWKVFEDAVSTASASSSESKDPKKKKPSSETSTFSTIQQLVVVISADIIEWGGTNSYPDLRDTIIRVLEAVFEWKRRDHQRRDVTLISRCTSGASMCFVVTDEKQSENIRLLAIGSISQAHALLKAKKSSKRGGTGVGSKQTGYFSKRFTYRNALTLAANAPARSVDVNEPAAALRMQKSVKDSKALTGQTQEVSAVYKSFASFLFLNDLRRGELYDNLHFYPPNLPPKIVVGPVLGRMTTYSIRSEMPIESDSDIIARDDDVGSTMLEQTVPMAALPILLEIDTSARITCIITDALSFQEIRVTEVLQPYTPHVFYIRSLLLERRYVYRFEGVSNAETRRGSFHTPPHERMMASTNFITTSSNFPEQLDGSVDSLWAPIRERVTLPWSGIDFIVHVGGQVPLHEAVTECVEWAARELRRKHHRGVPVCVVREDFESRLRNRIRMRMQQHYRCVWNLPNLRETLANSINWFLRAKADIAPIFGSKRQSIESDGSNWTKRAAEFALDEAKRVVFEYQLVLMREVPIGSNCEGIVLQEMNIPVQTARTPTPNKPDSVEIEQFPPEKLDAASLHQLRSEVNDEPAPIDAPSEPVLVLPDFRDEDCTSQLIQHGSTAFFVCDMRSVNPDDIITCNNRLQTPLKPTEGAIIGEQQWLRLENALKVKRTHAFILLLELPLILTSADHVDKERENRPISAGEHLPRLEDCLQKLYDVSDLSQHWVSCRRQLEQLLNLLFRWKLKRSGRDVLVVSGSMRSGIDSLVRDAQTGLSLRSVSVGPVTARVEPFAFPTSGVACPEFVPKSTAGSSSPTKAKKPSSEPRFTFASTLVPKRNYLLTHVSVTPQEDPARLRDAEDNEEDAKGAGKSCSALITAVFVCAQDADDVQNPEGLAISPSAHPVDLYKRLPSWWPRFVPMGRSVFWDDSVQLRAASDDELQALRSFLEGDRALAAALEACYDKYGWAEAARLEELRSAHARRPGAAAALTLRPVLVELWRLVPERLRRRLAFVLDVFVSELLLSHERQSDAALEAALAAGALEFAAFARLCRSLLWGAALLRLAASLPADPALRRPTIKQPPRPPAEPEAVDRAARKRAERLREAEEELAVARERRRLERLAGDELAAAAAALETRARALAERKARRAAAREERKRRQQPRQ